MLSTLGATWFQANQLLPPTKPIKVIVDHHLHNPKFEVPTIYLQVEPEAIVPQTQYLLANHRQFYKILTFNETVLNSCPNAILYLYGTSWIKKPDYESIDCSKKQFQLTSIFGIKDWTVGHRYRMSIFDKRDRIFDLGSKIGLSIKFYVSEHLFNHQHLKSEKTPVLPKEISAKIQMLETTQFHLCIENSRQNNYFTEKLLDTLITKTIPIYYGCPNISNYFDIRGWIILKTNTVEELEAKLQTLTPQWYQSYQTAIETNYQKAIEYYDFYTNVNKVLQQLPEFQQ